MQIYPVTQLLSDAGFAAPELRVLNPNHENYSALLLQPQGEIEADANGVRNADQDLDLIIASALEGLPEVISPNIPSLYKNNLDDRTSGLWDQLQALCRCGFRDVDCFYKYSIFAVFGGTK